jgi:hypothetical protein
LVLITAEKRGNINSGIIDMTKPESSFRFFPSAGVKIVLFAFVSAFLVGCVSQQSNTNNPPQTPNEANISAVEENSNIPEPTATVEPTKSPADIAKGLEGLNQNRTYKVEGDYLVDQYNKVPKAVLIGDGSWRKLDYANPEDAATMYANLVPVREEYINKELLTVRGGGRTLAQMHEINTRYLGDWEVEKVTYQGQEMDLYTILTGLRDGDGNLHVVRIPMDIPRYGPEHGILYMCQIDGTAQIPFTSLTMPRFLEELTVGERVGLEVYSDDKVVVPDFASAPENDYPTKSNTQQIIINEFFNEQANWRMSSEEKKALNNGGWPTRVVTLGQPQRKDTVTYDTGLTLYRRGSTFKDCPVW